LYDRSARRLSAGAARMLRSHAQGPPSGAHTVSTTTVATASGCSAPGIATKPKPRSAGSENLLAGSGSAPKRFSRSPVATSAAVRPAAASSGPRSLVRRSLYQHTQAYARDPDTISF